MIITQECCLRRQSVQSHLMNQGVLIFFKVIYNYFILYSKLWEQFSRFESAVGDLSSLLKVERRRANLLQRSQVSLYLITSLYEVSYYLILCRRLKSLKHLYLLIDIHTWISFHALNWSLESLVIMLAALYN